jgi:hypothetical protein
MMTALQTAFAQKMRVNLANGETFVYKVSQVESVIFDDGTASPEYVDLGLPSGTLWATFNVGATCPEDYGDYFAWGETRPKSSYSEGNYTVSVGNAKELPAGNDAATVNWGSEWRMPSYTQAMELIDDKYTTKEKRTIDGVDGIKVTSKINGKSIFLPFAGWKYNETLRGEGERSLFWTRSIDHDNSDNAFYCQLWSPGGNVYSYYRYSGNSIRPVSSAETNPILVTSIELSETIVTLNIAETASLIATVIPEYAENKAVTWESSDESVARVSDQGIVLAANSGTCTITCRATDGSGVKAECQVTVEVPDAYEYVDLGLPSGTLWATCNVGANSPEEYGDYFAWGETQPKRDYNWSSYQWMTEGQANWQWINKYTFADNQKVGCWYDGDTFIGDNQKELLPADDAATANWGKNWQMPSIEQCEELMNEANTTTTWTTQNGVAGLMITSRTNGNSIFLPAVGAKSGTNHTDSGTKAQYWSRTLYTNFSDYGFSMFASQNSFSKTGISRYYGHCIRPVRVYKEHGCVDLGLPSGTLWATCNVGANSPEEVGDYFAWGETEPKDNYTEDNYTFSIGDAAELPEKNDAATINWGSKWRMPSLEQIEELCKNTTAEWTTQNGVSVLKVTSKTNGKSIFLPTTGRWGNGSIYLKATSVEYWSRTQSIYDDNKANYMLMKIGNYNNNWSSAYNYSESSYYGHTVRAVRK